MLSIGSLVHLHCVGSSHLFRFERIGGRLKASRISNVQLMFSTSTRRMCLDSDLLRRSVHFAYRQSLWHFVALCLFQREMQVVGCGSGRSRSDACLILLVSQQGHFGCFARAGAKGPRLEALLEIIAVALARTEDMGTRRPEGATQSKAVIHENM